MGLFKTKREKLIEAVRKGNVSKVKKLLDSGADPDARGVYDVPVEGASQSDLPSVSTTALTYASSKGLEDIVGLLLDHGADVGARNQNGTTPLFGAVQIGNVPITKALLERGSKVNARDEEGWTPLMTAAAKGHPEVAKMLLERDADPTIKGNHGESALECARNSGSDEMVQLIEKALEASKSAS